MFSLHRIWFHMTFSLQELTNELYLSSMNVMKYIQQNNTDKG